MGFQDRYVVVTGDTGALGRAVVDLLSWDKAVACTVPDASGQIQARLSRVRKIVKRVENFIVIRDLLNA